jgi:uncharacterized protein
MNERLKKSIRIAPGWLFVWLLAAVGLMLVLAWVVPRDFWFSQFRRTYGLVNFAYLTYTLLIVGVVLLGIGRRRPAEIGLELRRLPAALAYTLLVWIALQAVMAGWYGISGKPIHIANGWSNDQALHKLGLFIGHFFGNALNEEVVFRGFLLTQFVLLLRRRWPRRPRTALVLAMLLHCAIFGAMHVPDRLIRQTYTSLSAVTTDQLELMVNACVFGWVFWRTDNLFFAVGLHGLSNLPTTLFAWHDFGPLTMPVPIVLALGAILAAIWPARASATTGPVRIRGQQSDG